MAAMTLDVLHVELTGGGPGLVVLRVAGRAFAPAPARLAPPTLLIADQGSWRRLATVAGTLPLPAGPDGPAFTVDVEVPLHLAAAEGPWWLEPGPAIADPNAPTHDPAQLDALRARVAALGAEVAALRARVEVGTASGGAKPSASAVALPRPRLRALRPTLPAILFAAGALAVGDAVATVVWQEPVSALWASHEQHGLESDLAELDATFAAPVATSTAQAPTPTTPAAPTPTPADRMRALARTLEHSTSSGHPIGELRIPRIHASYVVVQGTGASSLRRGPGHYLGTPLPGQPGTVGIAGHRTTYGAPFRHIDALRRGDPIDVKMPYGAFTYRVEGLRVVDPSDVSALRDIGRQRLVLTACHPLYSAAKRLLVIARLDRSTPRGAAAVPAAGTLRRAAPQGRDAPSATPPSRLAGDEAEARSPRA
ncbi:MAG TPA: class E sortase [Baekduia sp.]|nr:class E sortase [Baekduia sp.]